MGRLVKHEVRMHKPHSAGFLRGMAISQGVCQQKSETQPVVSRASTYKGCGWTLGSVSECKRCDSCVCNERTVKPKGHSSSHETFL